MVRYFVAALLAVFLVPSFGQAQDVGATDESASTRASSSGLYDRYENESKTDDIGIGAMVGTGISVGGKYWLNETGAVDANVGFGDDGISLVTDYLHHFQGAFADRAAFLSNAAPYVGAGLVMSFDEDGTDGLLNRDRDSVDDSQFALGVRVPVGIEYMPRTIPAGFFAEVAPGLGFLPDTFAYLQAGVGARFYF